MRLSLNHVANGHLSESIWEGNYNVKSMIFNNSNIKIKVVIFALNRCVSIQMHLRTTQNWLLLRKNDFSEWEVAHFWFKRMPTSFAHMRPSGGLMGEIYNMIMVLECFLRGYIEAMLVLRSDECELAVFSNTWKAVFCDTYNVLFHDFDIDSGARLEFCLFCVKKCK